MREADVVDHLCGWLESESWRAGLEVAWLDVTATRGDRTLIAEATASTLALRWSDLELDRARLTIRQTVTVANGVIVWQRDAVSDDSERTIALDTRTIAALNDHRRRQLAERLAAGPAWSTNEHDRDLVFTRPDGTALPPKRASQQFTRQVDAHALEGEDATAAETIATAIFGDR
jgi:integrase